MYVFRELISFLRFCGACSSVHTCVKDRVSKVRWLPGHPGRGRGKVTTLLISSYWCNHSSYGPEVLKSRCVLLGSSPSSWRSARLPFPASGGHLRSWSHGSFLQPLSAFCCFCCHVSFASDPPAQPPPPPPRDFIRPTRTIQDPLPTSRSLSHICKVPFAMLG